MLAFFRVLIDLDTEVFLNKIICLCIIACLHDMFPIEYSKDHPQNSTSTQYNTLYPIQEPDSLSCGWFIWITKYWQVWQGKEKIDCSLNPEILTQQYYA